MCAFQSCEEEVRRQFERKGMVKKRSERKRREKRRNTAVLIMIMFRNQFEITKFHSKFIKNESHFETKKDLFFDSHFKRRTALYHSRLHLPRCLARLENARVALNFCALQRTYTRGVNKLEPS